MENTNENNKKLEIENLEDVNGGISARQMMAAASLAFMGSSFAASSPIANASSVTQTATSDSASESEAEDTVYEGMRGMFDKAEKEAEAKDRHKNIANKILKLSVKAESPVTHETVIVAPTTDEDIPALKEFFKDTDYIRYLDASKETTEMSDTEIDKCFVKKDTVARFTIKKESGEVIGSFSATVGGNNKMEIAIGYSLGTAYQHKKYAEAACKAICDEIVNKVPEVKSFVSHYHKNNTGSKNLTQKIFNHLKEKDSSWEISKEITVKDKNKNETNTRYMYIYKK